jgi:hypothetical protein
MELGQVYFSISKGVLGQKIRAWGWFWNAGNLAGVLRARRAAQKRRRVSDRKFMEHFVGPIEIPTLKSPILKYVANPVFKLYWAAARSVMWW